MGLRVCISDARKEVNINWNPTLIAQRESMLVTDLCGSITLTTKLLAFMKLIAREIRPRIADVLPIRIPFWNVKNSEINFEFLFAGIVPKFVEKTRAMMPKKIAKKPMLTRVIPRSGNSVKKRYSV